MVEYCTANFIYLSFFLFVTTVAELDSSKFYIEFGLDNEIICNPGNDKTGLIEHLRKNKESAIIIKPSHVFETWHVNYNKQCKFKVKAPKGDGLFAVIQKMSLRRQGSECLDYIKFIREDVPSATKFCGKLDNIDGLKHYSPTITSKLYETQISDEQNEVEISKIQGMFEASSRFGKITTEIFISKQPLSAGEALDLVVVYTPYKNCATAEPRSLYQPGLSSQNRCITNHFVCDGYINCVSVLCSDESNCTNMVNRVMSDGTGTKVTVSAVTTIILCFIIFILCLWVCKKHKKLCWSPDCAGPSATVNSNTTGIPMERGDQNISNPPFVSAAPMLEVAVPTSPYDKDLPPSYESLFPAQPNTATNT